MKYISQQMSILFQYFVAASLPSCSSEPGCSPLRCEKNHCAIGTGVYAFRVDIKSLSHEVIAFMMERGIKVQYGKIHLTVAVSGKKRPFDAGNITVYNDIVPPLEMDATATFFYHASRV